MALSKKMKEKQCMNSKKRLFSWYYLRLFFSALIVLPLALMIILIKQILRLITLRIRRPMIREPIYFIRSESVEQIDEWNNYDEEKKTQEWLAAFDDDQILENARYVAEYNYHLENEQNNEENNLTKYPDVDYDDAIQ